MWSFNLCRFVENSRAHKVDEQVLRVDVAWKQLECSLGTFTTIIYNPVADRMAQRLVTLTNVPGFES